MGETQPNNDNDIDIAFLKDNYDNDNDNVNVQEQDQFNYNKYLKEKVNEKITDYRLDRIQEFLFGHNCFMSDCGVFVNPALKQIERFMDCWMNNLDDETRKIIVSRKFGAEKNKRDYKEFLNSPLWRFESTFYKVQRNFTCSMCSQRYQPSFLVVHHLSYEHLGSEILHPEDVTVVCLPCHLKAHGLGDDDE